MDRRLPRALLLLIAAQTLHSIEEYWFRLYDVLAPARAVSDALGIYRPAGFAIANIALIGFGLWCYFARVRPGLPGSRGLAWFWAVLEILNGLAHAALALAAGGYFPGIATAPLLLAAALLLVRALLADRWGLRAKAGLPLLPLLVLLATLPASPARADSWAAPQRHTYHSANRAFRLVVTPHVPADRNRRPFVTEPRGASAPGSAHAVLQRRDGGGRWRTQWQGSLRNEVMPVNAMVADSGRYFVTFDDWGGNGTGPNVVVIYDGTGRMIRAMSILDLLPEDYVRILPRSVSSIFWGGEHRFSTDGETLQLSLALPGESMFPGGYFSHPVTLATGEPALLAGPEWERAKAWTAIWRVMERGRSAARLAFVTDPILPPRSSDPEAWQAYLTEVLQRREGPLAGVPMVILFRRPPSQDYVRWGGTPRQQLLSPTGMYTAIASPDGLALAPALAPIVSGRRPGWLRGAQLLIVADEAAWPELLRVMGPSGATMIRIDPTTPIPQRPERLREHQEIQATLTPAETAQD